MILIIGGAFQGKLEYARERFALDESDILCCSENDGIVFGSKCINKMEEFALWCVRNGKDAVEILKEHREEWKDSILICEDIFCGVVPLGADMRAWREAAGRMCAYLSGEADSVVRIFCGLEQVLK